MLNTDNEVLEYFSSWTTRNRAYSLYEQERPDGVVKQTFYDRVDSLHQLGLLARKNVNGKGYTLYKVKMKLGDPYYYLRMLYSIRQQENQLEWTGPVYWFLKFAIAKHENREPPDFLEKIENLIEETQLDSFVQFLDALRYSPEVTIKWMIETILPDDSYYESAKSYVREIELAKDQHDREQ